MIKLNREEDIYFQAVALFDLFEDEIFNLEMFQFKLIELAIEAGNEGYWPIEGVLMTVSDCVEQFRLYEEDPIKNGYLLSRRSSGSFLNQFETYIED